MPRTVLTKIQTQGKNPTAFTTVVFTAGTVTPNFNSFVPTGNELILIRSTASTTLTIEGTKDAGGRTANKTLTLASGKDYVVGPLTDFHGWRFGDGTIHLNPSAITVTMAVIKLR